MPLDPNDHLGLLYTFAKRMAKEINADYAVVRSALSVPYVQACHAYDESRGYTAATYLMGAMKRYRSQAIIDKHGGYDTRTEKWDFHSSMFSYEDFDSDNARYDQPRDLCERMHAVEAGRTAKECMNRYWADDALDWFIGDRRFKDHREIAKVLGIKPSDARKMMNGAITYARRTLSGEDRMDSSSDIIVREAQNQERVNQALSVTNSTLRNRVTALEYLLGDIFSGRIDADEANSRLEELGLSYKVSIDISSIANPSES